VFARILSMESHQVPLSENLQRVLGQRCLLKQGQLSTYVYLLSFCNSTKVIRKEYEVYKITRLLLLKGKN
jgi:hypothetical protein